MGAALVSRRGGGEKNGPFCYRRHKWEIAYGTEQSTLVGGGYDGGGQYSYYSADPSKFGPILYTINSNIGVYKKIYGAVDTSKMDYISTKNMTAATAAVLVNKYCAFYESSSAGYGTLVTRVAAEGNRCRIYYLPMSLKITKTDFVITSDRIKQGFSYDASYIYEEMQYDPNSYIVI